MTLLVVLPIGLTLWYMLDLPGQSFRQPLAPATSADKAMAERLRAHVVAVASEEHNTQTPTALKKVAAYIQTQLQDMGYSVATQAFFADNETVYNVEVEIAGLSKRDEIVIIGAHYDSALHSPGANDNGSGVAMVLELARVFKATQPERTVRFVLFTNEEPPHFSTATMGSVVYANRSRTRRENIVAMLSLETIGHYSDTVGTQQYPIIFKPFFPSSGNFIAFVGDLRSRDLVHQTMGVFRAGPHLPSEGIAAFPWIKGIDWSDHSAFWKNDYRALMLTDTALFRYPHYHTAQDTPEKLNYQHMAKLFNGIEAVVHDLANGPTRP